MYGNGFFTGMLLSIGFSECYLLIHVGISELTSKRLSNSPLKCNWELHLAIDI